MGRSLLVIKLFGGFGGFAPLDAASFGDQF
jgi:hypothetical protein